MSKSRIEAESSQVYLIHGFMGRGKRIWKVLPDLCTVILMRSVCTCSNWSNTSMKEEDMPIVSDLKAPSNRFWNITKKCFRTAV